MKFREPRFYKGGGGGSSIASAPVPTPAPPVTSDSAEVIAAQNDYAKETMLKKSFKKTMIAGDTPWAPGQGGYPMGPGGEPASYKVNKV